MVSRKKMLVAYEMGLGKTCMTIAAIEQLKLKKPVLIIALSSLKYQWGKEIDKFSDSSKLSSRASSSNITGMPSRTGKAILSALQINSCFSAL